MGNSNKFGFMSSENNLFNFFIGIILIFLFVWLLIAGRSIILPLMISIFLAFILEPIVTILVKKRIPLGIAVFLTLIFAFVILYLLGTVVYANVQIFVGQFPVYQERLLKSVANFTAYFEQLFGEPLNIQLFKRIDWAGALQQFSIAQWVLGSVGSFVSFFVKMLMVIIFVAYLLPGMRNIEHKVQRAFPAREASRIVRIITNVTQQLQSYLGAKTLGSLITGIVSIIIFYIFGLDFAIFWGFLIFLFNFIPTIGSTLASLLPVIFSLLQFGSLSTAFWLAVIMVVLQIAMGNYVEPKLMGRSMNLSPLMVILSLIFWGYIWGVAGMILAVPILGTITIIFENFSSLKFISIFFRGKIKS
jgi:AI-2 transport protein TqsA